MTENICFTCKHWNITKWCDLKQKKRYWNSKCLKWEDSNAREQVLEYLAKHPPKYENYDHQLDATRLLHTRALNCTDRGHTEDEKEYRKKFINKLLRNDKKMIEKQCKNCKHYTDAYGCYMCCRIKNKRIFDDNNYCDEWELE